MPVDFVCSLASVLVSFRVVRVAAVRVLSVLAVCVAEVSLVVRVCLPSAAMVSVPLVWDVGW